MATIIYFASDYDMGETSSEDCAKFRSWAEAQITAEFPEHKVEVLNEQSLRQTQTDDFDNEQEIIDFCHGLWDSCPWDFE